MANGTIAFDTLSTSGQISGTAVSVDADYLAYGAGKVWWSIITDGSGFHGSFNTTSLTDNGTGDYTITFNNDMANDDYSFPVGTVNTTANDVSIVNSRQTGTMQQKTITANSGTVVDSQPCCTIAGELA